jgi:hypothetical protein
MVLPGRPLAGTRDRMLRSLILFSSRGGILIFH